MKIISLYITKELLIYTLAVMFIWLSVYAMFNYLAEIEKIGQANYTPLVALIYVALDLPSIAYSHSPVIVLLGSILATGNLATTSQLVVMQGSGMSILQINKVVVSAAFIFIAVIFIIGEALAPIANERAEIFRAKALGQNIYSISYDGFWIRDGDNIINVKNNFDGKVFGDVSVFSINKSNDLDFAVFAENAILDGDRLRLVNADKNIINETPESTKIQIDKLIEYEELVSFDTEFLESLKKDPKDLSIFSLYRHISFLKENKLAVGYYEVEFYKRLIKPVTLIAMILLSMLFIFGSLRSASLGKKIFLGIMLSLFFELSLRIGGAISLSLGFNLLLITFLPSLLVLVAALLLIYIRSTRW